MKLTDEECRNNDKISSDIINIDIKDTVVEIEKLKKEIQEREEFVEFLNCILKFRENNHGKG